MALLEVANLSTTGPGGFKLEDITFSQRRLERIAVAGETGAGKSTLLKIIAGLAQRDSGTLLFEREMIPGPAETLVPGHPRIAYLSQHFELQKSLRVEQVLEYSNKLSDAEASDLYKVCQIDHLLRRRTDELSGGEKQRVAICRLLISRPRLLLLDEPFSHLDMVHKNTLKSVVRAIGDKLKITCMLVSHDPLDTLPWADCIIAMKDGRVVQKADPRMVYDCPANEYVAGLFGKYNLLGRKDRKMFGQLKGLKKVFDAIREQEWIFLRPEHFRTVKKKPGAVRAKITKVLYQGGYSEIEVIAGQKPLTVRVSNGNLGEGEIIYLDVNARNPWLLIANRPSYFADALR